MTQRIERVNSLLEKEISALIAKDFNFPEALVTVSRVDTTMNLIETRVYISVLPEENLDMVVLVLNKGVVSIQKKINKMLNMRPVPKIIFVKDTIIAEAAKIEALIEKIKEK